MASSQQSPDVPQPNDPNDVPEVSNGTGAKNAKRVGKKQRVTDLKTLNDREHALLRPGMFIGGTEWDKRDVVILEKEASICKDSTTLIPYGMEKLAIEVINNAGDGVIDAFERYIDDGEIFITYDNPRLTVRNTGITIPVEIHPDTGSYGPHMAFGDMRTSTSYTKKESRTGGTNGVGAKLANIYSKEFSIEVADADNKLVYRQTWHNNMERFDPPAIEPYEGVSYVQVSYIVDFQYKEWRRDIDRYPDEFTDILRAHAVNHAIACQCPVFFNGEDMSQEDVLHFADILPAKATSSDEPPVKLSSRKHMFWYEWPVLTRRNKTVKTRSTKNPNGTEHSRGKEHVLPTFEVVLFDTPDEGVCRSFVNGIETSDGGMHVNALLEGLRRVLEPVLNKKMGSGNLRLKPEKIKKHITILMNCRIAKASYESQTKKKLTSPKMAALHFSPSQVKELTTWDAFKGMEKSLDKGLWAAAITRVAKSKIYLEYEKLDDAHDAGKANMASSCYLVITEGDSAQATALTIFPDRQKYGVFPIRGKGLNIQKASSKKTLKNKEIAAIINIMGFRQGVDYRKPENYNKLRYGHIIFLTDSDADGRHIKGLLYTLVHGVARTFVQVDGAILDLRTVCVKATKGSGTKQVIKKFYNPFEYKEWLANLDPTEKWQMKYYKGLGTLTIEDALNEGENPFLVGIKYTEATEDMLHLIFGNVESHKKKKWLREYKERPDLYNSRNISAHEFLDLEVGGYSLVAIERSLPGFDGLKEGQRKLVYAMLSWAGYVKGSKDGEDYKVMEFAGYTSNFTGYHYGPVSLEGATIKMAAGYVGANNIPVFKGNGRFGSRKENGGAAASRYIFVQMYDWIRWLIRKEDAPILKHIKEDGIVKEPETFLPLVPFSFINGVVTISSGWSSFMAPYNIFDVIHNLRVMLEERLTPKRDRKEANKLKKLVPYYRGYKGEIVFTEGADPELNDVEEMEEEEEEGSPDDGEGEASAEKPKKSKGSTGPCMLMKGVFEDKGKGVVEVTELPVSISQTRYKKVLNKMVEEKKISSYKSDCTEFDIKFTIKGVKNPDHKSLGLVRKKALTNMVFLVNGQPKKYATAESYLSQWFKERLPHYKSRKQSLLQEITKQVERLQIKLKLILLTCSIDGKPPKIPVQLMKRSDVIEAMKKEGIPEIDVKKAKMLGLSADSADDIRQKIASFNEEYKVLQATKIERMYLKDLEELEDALNKREKEFDAELKEHRMKLAKQLARGKK